MRTILKIIFLFAFSMSSLAQQQVDLSKTWRGNTKYWQELVFSFPASSKINLNLRLSNRYSNEIKNHSQFIEAGFKYSFLEKVKLHSEFLFRRELYELTDWRANEHRVTLGTGLSFKLGKWSFSNRHRMEWLNSSHKCNSCLNNSFSITNIGFSYEYLFLGLVFIFVSNSFIC